MSYFNYFLAELACPSCGRTREFKFQADIGVLRFDSYALGEQIANERRPGERFPIGPDPSCDWDRPFWAAGLDRCAACESDIRVRIEVRSRRFDAAVPDDRPRDDFAWGYLDLAGAPARNEQRRNR